MNKYYLASLVARELLDDETARKLTAAKQRELFGYVPFGKRSVAFNPNNQGEVRVASNPDGTGTVTRTYSYEEAASLISSGKDLYPW